MRAAGMRLPGTVQTAGASGHRRGLSPAEREERGFLLPSSHLPTFCACHQLGCGFLVFLHDLSNRWV